MSLRINRVQLSPKETWVRTMHPRAILPAPVGEYLAGLRAQGLDTVDRWLMNRIASILFTLNPITRDPEAASGIRQMTPETYVPWITARPATESAPAGRQRR